MAADGRASQPPMGRWGKARTWRSTNCTSDRTYLIAWRCPLLGGGGLSPAERWGNLLACSPAPVDEKTVLLVALILKGHQVVVLIGRELSRAGLDFWPGERHAREES